MTKLHELADLGQSIWLDYIRRSFLVTGELQRLVDMGLRGVTSNPSIFDAAISKSDDYDEQLERLVRGGYSLDEIYHELIVDDIRTAADILRPVYDQTGGRDGFVSLEVNPHLANDTESTIAEARSLWQKVSRPNLMVKIPATRAGLPAITQATQDGINVNITLIFSRFRYGEVIAAFIKGMLIRHKSGLPIDHIASVASFFVSRVDTKVDGMLEGVIEDTSGALRELAQELRGKAGVANAQLAYRQFQEVFLGETFAEMREAGAAVQRPLWASTSTKNPEYSDILYVQELIAPHTVNTLPEDTLEAFLDHGEVLVTIPDEWNEPTFVMQSLADLGISMERVTKELEEEGVEKFAESHDQLLDALRSKCEQIAPGGTVFPGLTEVYSNPEDITAHLGEAEAEVASALDRMEEEEVLSRIWRKDHTVWNPEPKEISNRLGWLDIAERVAEEDLADILEIVDQVREEGFTQAVLLGMGGSSLAPELFAKTFAQEGRGIALTVLDTTDPEAVLRVKESLNPLETVFLVSSKSGTTVETLSLFWYFYNWVAETIAGAGQDREPGEHFIAITDPKSFLADLGKEHNFRNVVLADPNIGGRFSALSPFGLLPAGLVGADVSRLIERATGFTRAMEPGVSPLDNPAARLGTILGVLARRGRDKLTFVLPPELESFGNWVEQLLAESTGKQGAGILPVVGEPLGLPAVYDEDRVFVRIVLPDSETPAEWDDLIESGFPAINLRLRDRYDIAAQLLLWEMATAIAGYHLGINPFDQPDVEKAKVRAREMLDSYQETGELPSRPPLLSERGITVYGPEEVEAGEIEWNLVGDTPGEALASFLAQAEAGNYIAIQAFLPPGEEVYEPLQRLRLLLRDRYRVATTFGFGPRFLHSTGQLHKGGPTTGLFLQFTREVTRDAEIPAVEGEEESPVSFGTLEMAQALGDFRALQDAGQRAVRFHLMGDHRDLISQLTEGFRESTPA